MCAGVGLQSAAFNVASFIGGRFMGTCGGILGAAVTAMLDPATPLPSVFSPY